MWYLVGHAQPRNSKGTANPDWRRKRIGTTPPTTYAAAAPASLAEVCGQFSAQFDTSSSCARLHTPKSVQSCC